MAFVNIVLPDTLAFGSRGGRRYSTDIVINRGGYEKRNQNWADPLGMWEIGMVNRTLAQTLQLQAFLHRMKGKTHSFLFLDHKDSQMKRVAASRITSTTYQLRQRYSTLGETTFVDVIHPDPDTLDVSLGGRPTSGWSVDPTTGIVTLAAGVGTSTAVQGTGRYYIEVRFDTDHFEPEENEQGIYSWPSIPLVEVRP
jgi:uncharacterized protein (TIGR02217 family)